MYDSPKEGYCSIIIELNFKRIKRKGLIFGFVTILVFCFLFCFFLPIVRCSRTGHFHEISFLLFITLIDLPEMMTIRKNTRRVFPTGSGHARLKGQLIYHIDSQLLTLSRNTRVFDFFYYRSD